MTTTANASYKWYQQPLNKTLFYSFIWAFIAVLFTLPGDIALWQYAYLIGSVPSMLLWDLFDIRSPLSALIVASINLLILLSPLLIYRKIREQFWWFYLSISVYALANAGLGITMIISMRNITH